MERLHELLITVRPAQIVTVSGIAARTRPDSVDPVLQALMRAELFAQVGPRDARALTL